MPAFISHHLFAQKLIQALPITLSKQEERAFLWGAQGPDVLFFQSDISPLPVIGRRMHREEVSVFLQVCRDYVLQQDDPVLTAYYLGFLSHYCLDSALHPYVYALQRRLMQKGLCGGVHNRIESDIDTALLHLFVGRPPGTFSVRELAGDKALYKKVAPLLQHGIAAVYGRCFTRQQIIASFYSMLFLMTAFQNGAGLHRLIRKGEAMCGVSYALSGHFHYHTVSQSVLNLNHRCWTDHGGCRRSDSVIDMMSAAADHWYSTVRAALSGEDMAPYAEKPYNYGKY